MQVFSTFQGFQFFIVCRHRWVVIQLSAVVLAGFTHTEDLKAAYFQKFEFFVFENHEKMCFFFFR